MKNVTRIKYLVSAVKNENFIQRKLRRHLILVMFVTIQSRLLSKIVKISIYKTVILPVVL
jgi:hypothetical protein